MPIFFPYFWAPFVLIGWLIGFDCLGLFFETRLHYVVLSCHLSASVSRVLGGGMFHHTKNSTLIQVVLALVSVLILFLS